MYKTNTPSRATSMTNATNCAHEFATDAALGPLFALIENVERKLDKILETLAGATKDFFTVEEVAAMTGRSPYTVRSWIKAGRIRAERVSGTGPRGRLLIPRDEIATLISCGLGAAVSAVTVDDRRAPATMTLK